MAESDHPPAVPTACDYVDDGAPTQLAQHQNDENPTGGEILENLAISEESKGENDIPLPDNEYAWVPFDAQTTGFERNTEIIQLAMQYDNREFNRYILPSGEIHPNASVETGMTMKDGNLYHNDIKVETVDREQCFADMMTFLSEIHRPVALYGHNARNFDSLHVVRALAGCGQIISFKEIVSGFSDTLPALREKHSKEGKTNTKCDMGTLVNDCLGETYQQPGALGNVKYLQRLCTDDLVLGKHSFSVDRIIWRCQCLQRKESLEEMVVSETITSYAAEKIANSGFNFGHLARRNKESGEEGLECLLQPILRASYRKVAQKVADYLEHRA